MAREGWGDTGAGVRATGDDRGGAAVGIGVGTGSALPTPGSGWVAGKAGGLVRWGTGSRSGGL